MNFAAIDFETANRQPNSACSVGIAVVREGEIVDSIHCLIRPPEDDFAFTDIHGIAWEDVCEEPSFAEVWKSIEPSLEGLDFFAAHNASFDRNVLYACCDDALMPYPLLPFVCSMKTAGQVWQPRRKGLAYICRALGIPLDHHNAESDAEACAYILIMAHQQGWQPLV